MKKRLRQLLEQREIDQIIELAGASRRVLSLLVSLTFDRDPQIAWRAVEAMGVAAERIAQNDPECVRDHLGRLYWLVNEESGGICWRAPECMAEIVRRLPTLFADYVPIIVSLLREMADEDLEHFRPGVLWAIGRLGPLAQAELDAVLSAIEACLDHPDPQVRGMAVWCLGQTGQAKLLAARPNLSSDDGPVDFFEDGLVNRTQVCHLVRRAFGDTPS